MESQWQDIIDKNPQLLVTQIEAVNKVLDIFSNRYIHNKVCNGIFISRDDDIYLFKKIHKDYYYLVIGDDEQDITYARVGNTYGDFEFVHKRDNTLEYMVYLFINADKTK